MLLALEIGLCVIFVTTKVVTLHSIFCTPYSLVISTKYLNIHTRHLSYFKLSNTSIKHTPTLSLLPDLQNFCHPYSIDTETSTKTYAHLQKLKQPQTPFLPSALKITTYPKRRAHPTPSSIIRPPLYIDSLTYTHISPEHVLQHVNHSILT